MSVASRKHGAPGFLLVVPLVIFNIRQMAKNREVRG